MDLRIPESMEISVVEGPGPGPGPARTSNFLATASIAWDHKSGLGLQVLPGTTSPAWDYKSCLGLQVFPA